MNTMQVDVKNILTWNCVSIRKQYLSTL